MCSFLLRFLSDMLSSSISPMRRNLHDATLAFCIRFRCRFFFCFRADLDYSSTYHFVRFHWYMSFWTKPISHSAFAFLHRLHNLHFLHCSLCLHRLHAACITCIGCIGRITCTSRTVCIGCIIIIEHHVFAYLRRSLHIIASSQHMFASYLRSIFSHRMFASPHRITSSHTFA